MFARSAFGALKSLQLPDLSSTMPILSGRFNRGAMTCSPNESFSAFKFIEDLDTYA
jgi:hypothetical protein